MRGMRRGVLTRYWIPVIATGLVTLFFVGSCEMADRGPTSPVAKTHAETAQPAQAVDEGQQNNSGRAGFYPLEIGNHWAYSGEFTIVEELYGSGVSDTARIFIEEDRTIIGTEELFGREYVVEEQEERSSSSSDVTTQWIRYRQDRAGLYEADVLVTEHPAATKRKVTLAGASAEVSGGQLAALWRQVTEDVDPAERVAYERALAGLAKKLEAIEGFRGRVSRQSRELAGPPGGVLSNELTRLRYPLHPGQEWTVREVPFFGSAVDGHEVLNLPPGRMSGFRIRITGEFFTPEDVVLLWYGRDGFLGWSYHIESELVDLNGQVIGRLVVDRSLFLENLELVRQGRF